MSWAGHHLPCPQALMVEGSFGGEGVEAMAVDTGPGWATCRVCSSDGSLTRLKSQSVNSSTLQHLHHGTPFLIMAICVPSIRRICCSSRSSSCVPPRPLQSTCLALRLKHRHLLAYQISYRRTCRSRRASGSGGLRETEERGRPIKMARRLKRRGPPSRLQTGTPRHQPPSCCSPGPARRRHWGEVAGLGELGWLMDQGYLSASTIRRSITPLGRRTADSQTLLKTSSHRGPFSPVPPRCRLHKNAAVKLIASRPPAI
jgi:hypothetical protein